MTCFRGVNCHRESVSQHYMKNGIGRVGSKEEVIYVVFDSLAKIGEKLSAKDFPSRRIAKGEFSLARDYFITTTEMQDHIIEPRLASGSIAVGLAYAKVQNIRYLYSIIDKVNPALSLRGVCVIDRVEDGDHMSHAALIFCEEEKKLSDKWKGLFRAAIAADLCEEFGPVRPIQPFSAKSQGGNTE